MKTSYILEHSMGIKVEIDMGDLILLIDYTTQASEVDGPGYSARATSLLKALKKTKKEAAESAVRDFQRMVDAD